MRSSALNMARNARLEKGGDTDYELYEHISEHPGLSAYEYAKVSGWSIGRTHSSIKRLEKKGLIKTEHVVEGSRVKLVARPKPWQEFFTKEELEEMKQSGFWDELEMIVTMKPKKA
ncbi:MAG: winged helix-turn-helix domain-containing protein [Methanotrichaceae archaeon]